MVLESKEKIGSELENYASGEKILRICDYKVCHLRQPLMSTGQRTCNILQFALTRAATAKGIGNREIS